MDELYVLWLMIGWGLAFWAGYDLHLRVTRWLRARQEAD